VSLSHSTQFHHSQLACYNTIYKTMVAFKNLFSSSLFVCEFKSSFPFSLLTQFQAFGTLAVSISDRSTHLLRKRDMYCATIPDVPACLFIPPDTPEVNPFYFVHLSLEGSSRKCALSSVIRSATRLKVFHNVPQPHVHAPRLLSIHMVNVCNVLSITTKRILLQTYKHFLIVSFPFTSVSAVYL
jgi:hypothetical protein